MTLRPTPTHANSWRRKQLLAGKGSHFPLGRWWRTDELYEIGRLYFADRLLALSGGRVLTCPFRGLRGRKEMTLSSLA